MALEVKVEELMVIVVEIHKTEQQIEAEDLAQQGVDLYQEQVEKEL